MGVVAGALGSYALIQSVTVPTLPMIQRTLDADQATANWILVAFFLSASIATPILGRVGDSYGRRRVFVLSVAMICVGAVLASVAPTIQVMIAARVVQGIGGGAIPLSFALIRDCLPARKVPGAVGLASSLIPLGYAAGIVIAGPLTALVGLAGLFLLPAVVAAGSALAARALIPDRTPATRASVPVLPAVILAGWLAALLLGITRAPTHGWLDPSVLLLGLAAGVLCAAWIVLELRATSPLIDLRLLADRGVWSVNLVSLLSGGVMTGLYGLLPQFAQTPASTGYGFGATPSEAGRMLLPTTATNFLGGILSVRCQRLVGPRAAIVGGGVLAATFLGVLALRHAGPWQVALVAACSGLGAGLYFAAVSTATVQAVAPEHTGVAAGMSANLRTIGGTVGAAITATVVTSHEGPSGFPVEIGYERGFVFLAVLSASVGVAALLIPGRGRVRTERRRALRRRARRR
jgi:MFS family permease